MKTRKIDKDALRYYLDNYNVKNIVIDNENIIEISDGQETIWKTKSSFAYTLLKDGTYSVKGIDPLLTSFDVPSVFNNRPVTKIEDYAFVNCPSVFMVNIPEGITTIGKGAFSDCKELIQISMPFVENIEEGACRGCTSLASILCGKNGRLKTIGRDAFYECTKLDYFEMPNSLEIIERGAFWKSGYGFDSIIIPANVKRIEQDAFNTNEVWDVTFKGTPEYISDHAFGYNTRNVAIFVPWSSGQVPGAPWGSTGGVYYNQK